MMIKNDVKSWTATRFTNCRYSVVFRDVIFIPKWFVVHGTNMFALTSLLLSLLYRWSCDKFITSFKHKLLFGISVLHSLMIYFPSTTV